MTENPTLGAMTEARRSIVMALKSRGPLGIGELSEGMDISYEGVRQHLRHLQRGGWITRCEDGESSGPGRPRSSYRLTSAGDHLFPKEYDQLAVALIDAASETLGPEAVRSLLEEVARRKVEQWEPTLKDLSLDQRLQALTGIYATDDPHCRVEIGDGEAPRLVEMNCPYLEVARRRPALCSVTVSVLRRLLGHDVVRTERFQAGDGRCVFKVLKDRKLEAEQPLFDWERAAEARSASS